VRTSTLHSRYIKPQLPPSPRADRSSTVLREGEGCYLVDGKGDRYLDFLSGFGVFALGRSHPTIVRALHGRPRRRPANLVQMDCSLLSASCRKSWSPVRIGHRARVLPQPPEREVRGSAIKFARARHESRTRILYCDHAFHGLTTGALPQRPGRNPERLRSLLPGAESIRSVTRPLAGSSGVVTWRLHRRADSRAGVYLASRSSGGGAVALPPPQGVISRRGAGGMGPVGGRSSVTSSSASRGHHHGVQGALGGYVPWGPCSPPPRCPTPCTARWIGGGPLLDVQHQPAGDGRDCHPGGVRRRGHPRPRTRTGKSFTKALQRWWSVTNSSTRCEDWPDDRDWSSASPHAGPAPALQNGRGNPSCPVLPNGGPPRSTGTGSSRRWRRTT